MVAPRRAHSKSTTFGAEDTSTAGREIRWWRLVWCYDRCFLPECEERRRALSEATRSMGAALICLKRAARLQTWLQEHKRPSRSKNTGTGGSESILSMDEGSPPPPYVLMTDHRQAATCLEAALKFAPGHKHMPSLVVVLCESAQQLEPLLPLVQHIQRISPVHVCLELGTPKVFVNRLMGHLTGSPVPPALFEPSLDMVSKVAQPQLLHWSEVLPHMKEEAQLVEVERKQHPIGREFPQMQASHLCHQQAPQPHMQRERSNSWVMQYPALPQSDQTDMLMGTPVPLATSPQNSMIATTTSFCLPTGFTVDAVALPAGTRPGTMPGTTSGRMPAIGVPMETIQPSLYPVLLQHAPAHYSIAAASPVESLLVPFGVCGNTELDKMLRAAMPERYDD